MVTQAHIDFKERTMYDIDIHLVSIVCVLWENLLGNCMRLGKNENQLLPARQIRISGQFSLVKTSTLQIEHLEFHSRQNAWENAIHFRHQYQYAHDPNNCTQVYN